MRVLRGTASLLLLLPLLSACAGSSPVDAGPIDLDGGPNDDGGAIAAQMNDVSILFPIPADAGPEALALIPVSASGARGQLMSQTLYDAVGHITGDTFTGQPMPDTNGDAVYADLHVVGMRIDPCFAAPAPDPHGAGCLNQLRLVVQEVRRFDSDSPYSVHDSALHLFYALSRAELEAFVREVIALRMASGGAADLGPLQPHPLMLSEGPSGKFATGLRALILAHAGMQNLTRIAEMSADSEVFLWTFQAFDLSDAEDDRFTPFVIPTLDGGTTQQFGRGFGAGGGIDGQFFPETSSSTDLAPMANADTAAMLTPAQRQGAFDALVSVENPKSFSPNNIDCASCHLAMVAEQLNAAPLYGFTETGNPNAFIADTRFVAPADLAPTLNDQTLSAFNVHAFSYTRDGSAGINQRTVNETAAVVAYLGSLQ